MKKILPWLRRATALATLTVAALLCWQCIDIYITGSAARSAEEGSAILAVYTAQDVGARLRALAIPFAAYAALIAATVIAGRCVPAQGRHNAATAGKRLCGMKQRMASRSAAEGRGPARVLRVCLYVAAILFIVLGVMNGGLHDVLVKAIMICTECIGLG